MKILLGSYVFHPGIGGIETASLALGEQFVRFGHQVTVVTQSQGEGQDAFPFTVVRRPGQRRLWKLIRQHDIYFQNNISLQMLWPLFLTRKPWVVTHQTWLGRESARQTKIKRAVIRRARNIAISQAIADKLSTPAEIIGNPYRSALFQEQTDIPRERDLVFLGRLVTDKGLDVLLQAMALLRPQGLCPTLTVIGSGPEQQTLQALSRELQIEPQITFVGPKSGTELVHLLNGHHIMVVPSRWEEPFGIVALEGIACGCVVVGSANGGLKEAIGPCGRTFPNGDSKALASVLADLLHPPHDREAFRSIASQHLSRFRPENVAREYLNVFERTIG